MEEKEIQYKGLVNDSYIEGWRASCVSVETETLQGSPPIKHIIHLALQDRGEVKPFVTNKRL